MAYFVDEQFKLNIYLDTNILVDYIESASSVLVESLDFLAQSAFVILRSSHYVEYEMTEVRKKRLFYYKVRNRYPLKGESLAEIKQTWELDGKKYDEFREEITQTVISEFGMLEEKLGVRFDDHVLHNKLIYPTRDLCLATKVSREDSMVMVSCMYPNQDELLEYGVLMSNDKQYISASVQSKDKINEVFQKYGIHLPVLLNAKELNNGSELLNMLEDKDIDKENLHSFWTVFLLNLIRKKNQKTYLGHTIKIGKSKRAADLVFIDIEEPSKQLIDSSGLFFVLNDLSGTIEIGKDFDYWDDKSSVSLPHVNTDDTEYSIKPQINLELLAKIQERGNLVFYSV